MSIIVRDVLRVGIVGIAVPKIGIELGRRRPVFIARSLGIFQSAAIS
jgi:hypothetical protein